MTKKTPYDYTTKRKKRKSLGAADFLGLLFESMFEASRKYPPIEKTRANDIFKEADAMWRKAMMLCHPDKHSNSELSQEVTRWLIANRPGGKRA